MNVLEASGKPLFFRVAEDPSPGIASAGGAHAVRVVARSLSVMQKEALVTSSLSGQTWRVSSDEGAYLNGDDAAPCPLAHMTAGMVASFMESVVFTARARGLDLGPVRLIQDNYYTMKGSALQGTMTGGALPVRLTVETGPDLDPAAEAVIADAVRTAPVRGLMDSVLPSRFTLTHNGRAVPLDDRSALDRPAVALSADLFDSARPAGADWSALMRRNGLSPRTAEVTSSEGSSYAEVQSRQLHIRGICTLGPDGIKRIEQHLFNPHGSIFHLLSEEGVPAGGQGRAPDAMSYVSAGLAFCFLTQFGRYAKIVRRPLRQYAVVQDTRFGRFGGSPGAATAVETHVHLETGEDDEFARKALAMSEQTCFLHALCRSTVPVQLSVVRS